MPHPKQRRSRSRKCRPRSFQSQPRAMDHFALIQLKRIQILAQMMCRSRGTLLLRRQSLLNQISPSISRYFVLRLISMLFHADTVWQGFLKHRETGLLTWVASMRYLLGRNCDQNQLTIFLRRHYAHIRKFISVHTSLNCMTSFLCVLMRHCRHATE